VRNAHKSFSRITQRGVAIVELTIALPLMLLLIFVTAEFGRAFIQYNTLTKAVRDSVRHVASEALLGQTGNVMIDTNLQLAAQNLVVYGNVNGVGTAILPGLDIADVTVAPALGVGDISLSASYAYAPMFLVLPGFGLGPDTNPFFTLRTASTMRAL